jgi:hypothetical protein
MRHIPIFTFINKMDRDAMDTFELLDDIEKELGIATCPVNWPIGSGKGFKGVYDRNKKCVICYSDTEKGMPMYRQLNPYAFAGAHNYTCGVHERDVLISRGWKDEGIGFYGLDAEMVKRTGQEVDPNV